LSAIADILSPTAVAAINRPTKDAVCLPNAAYTAPEILEAERKALFSETWAFAGVGAQIPDPGDVVPLTLAGLPLLAVREPTGGIRVFHNVCRHRGVQLVAEPQKKRPRLVCRYHSWTYGLDGALLMTPFFGGPDNHDSPCIDRSAWGWSRFGPRSGTT